MKILLVLESSNMSWKPHRSSRGPAYPSWAPLLSVHETCLISRENFEREEGAAASPAAFVPEPITKRNEKTISSEEWKEHPKETKVSVSVYSRRCSLYTSKVAWVTKSSQWHANVKDTSLDADINTNIALAFVSRLDVVLYCLSLVLGQLKIDCCTSIRHHSTLQVYCASYAPIVVPPSYIC